MSCSSLNNEPKTPKSWDLSKNSSSPKIDLKPHTDDPLKFPAGTFDWQPKNTPIIVHTYLESMSFFQYNGDVYNYIYQHLFDGNLGLEVNFKSKYLEKTATMEEIREPVWVSFDHPDFRINNQLVFYEVTPYTYYKKKVRGTYKPLWQMTKDWWAYQRPGTGVSFLIKKDPKSNADLNNVTVKFPNGEPQVNDYWLKFVRKASKEEDDNNVTVYQWLPKSNQVITRTFKFVYTKPTYKNNHLPALWIKPVETAKKVSK